MISSPTSSAQQAPSARSKSSSSKRYRVSQLAREKPACPHCGFLYLEKDRDPEQCPSCKANYSGTLNHFKNFPALPLSPFIDPQNIIAEAGQPLILGPLEKLSKKFPQLRTTFCTLNLTAKQDPRLIGFWLLNTAPLTPGEEARERAWQLLIIADQQNRRLSITTGYALEPYLPDSELTSLLEQARPLYFQGEVENALQNLTKGLEEILNKSHRHAKRVLKRKSKKIK